MSITRWTHDNPFIPGTVVRAGAMNAKLDGVAVSIKSIVDRIDKRVPQLPPNFTGNPVIPEQDLNNSLLYISPAGNLTVYRLNTFTNQIEEVVQLRNETESLRDETLQIRNEVEQLKDQSSDFAFNAEQSASDSAGYRDESAYWAQEAQVIAEALGTGVVFYGDWDASSGNFPDEPPVGSGMWKISSVGQSGGLGAFSNVNVGDTLIWFSTESRWILLDTRDQVVSVNGYKGAVEIDVADLASITNFSATLLGQSTGSAWRSQLSVLQYGAGGTQIRNNQQLDARYVPGSSTQVLGQGANSRSRYGSISITGVKGNYVGIHFSPSDLIFMTHSDGSRSGLYDEAASSWKWYFDGNGALAEGTVPWSSITGKPGLVGTSGAQAMNGPLTITQNNSNGVLRLARGSGNPTIVPYNDTWMIIEGAGNLGLNYYADGHIIAANGGGNLYVGKTSGSFKLDVNGTIKGNTVRGSDPILKDVQYEKLLTLDEICSLRSVVFKWKYGENKGETSYGILADEVEKVAPFLVSWSGPEYEEDEKGNKLSLLYPRHRNVDYDGLSTLIGISLARHELNKWYRRLWHWLRGKLKWL